MISKAMALVINYLNTPTTSTGVSVGGSSTQLLAANQNRRYACIVNDGPYVVYLAFGTSAVVSRGIRLNPNGGSYEIGPGNLFCQAVNAIASGGTSNVTVLEA